jgi:hypothetical protein
MISVDPLSAFGAAGVGMAQLLQPEVSSGVCGMTGVSGCSTTQLLQAPSASFCAGGVGVAQPLQP